MKDLEASRAFYAKLGFEVFGGVAEQNWLILKNGDHTIGLFQGMFEENLMTFNPGNESTASGRTSNQDHGGGIVITVGNGAIGVVSGAGSTPGWGQAEGESMAPMD